MALMLLLERNDDVRGLASPDDGDALPLTFAHPYRSRDSAEERRLEGIRRLTRWMA
jgi:hypothetical protein